MYSDVFETKIAKSHPSQAGKRKQIAKKRQVSERSVTRRGREGRQSERLNMPPTANPNPDHAHAVGKMQDAGWQADLERWESDEDSDDSDGEAELDLSEVEVLRLMA